MGNAEQGEERARAIRELTAQSLKNLLDQSRQLTGDVSEAISDNPLDQIPEIVAALQFSESISHLARTMIESHGGVIFSRDQVPQVQPERLLIPNPDKDNDDKPKGFGELLRRRIDEFLPEEREHFRIEELKELIGKGLGTMKAIKAEGLFVKEKVFSREEAVGIF